MTQLDPVLNAIKNHGGTATIAQVSTATAMKREAVRDHLTSFVSSGLVDHVGGSIYRIKPERLTAASEAPTPASTAPKAADKPKAETKAKRRVGERGPDRKRRKSPVGDKVIEALKALDGSGTAKEIAQVANLTPGQVGDACYKLRSHGEVESPEFGTYALVGYTAPEAAPAPAEEVVAPEATETAPEAVEVPVQAPEVIDPHADERLIAEALSLLAPKGTPITSKALKATANFVAAAEKVLKVSRG